MKKLLILLLIASFSHAGIDEILKKNPFVDLTQKNVDNIKISAGLLIGSWGVGQLIISRHGLQHIQNNFNEKVNDIDQELKIEVEKNPTLKTDLENKHAKKLKDFTYEKNKKYFWFGFTRTFALTAPLGYLFYWWKSN